MRQLLVAALLCGTALGIPVQIRVLDPTGAAIKDALVIVQVLSDREREVLRTLSDVQGAIPLQELKPGLYRVIATTPYGLWRTRVKEFAVAGNRLEVEVKMQAQPTHGNGDVVTVGTTRAEVQVLSADGEAVAGADVLVRDQDATLYLQRWYKTDPRGRAQVELVSVPTVLVVVYKGFVTTTEVPSGEKHVTVRFPPF